jgi:hypothetical protein
VFPGAVPTMLPLRRDEVLRTSTVRGLWTSGRVEQRKTTYNKMPAEAHGNPSTPPRRRSEPRWIPISPDYGTRLEVFVKCLGAPDAARAANAVFPASREPSARLGLLCMTSQNGTYLVRGFAPRNALDSSPFSSSTSGIRVAHCGLRTSETGPETRNGSGLARPLSDCRYWDPLTTRTVA